MLDAEVTEAAALLRIARDAAAAGVDVIQLRDKHCSDGVYIAFAKELKGCIRGRPLFIINDRVHLAGEIDADGVHLGQDDMPLAEARRMLGPDMLIGSSCQNMPHLKAAHEQGADYVGFGSVFKTQTKPGRQPMDLALLAQAAQISTIPLFAIGGIALENVEAVLARGVTRVALTRAVCEAEDVKGVVKEFKRILGKKEIAGAGVVQW